MNKLIYIHQHIEKINGHSIVDIRLTESLRNQANGSFVSLQYDNKKKKIINGKDVSEIDEACNVIILSHFNTFKLARHFKKSKVAYINHDLPYFAYLMSKNPVDFLKAVYSWLYIKYFWRYSDFNFFISKNEWRKSGRALQKSACLKIGSKRIEKIPEFKSLQPTAIFTGNYKWSLKAKSLQNVFRSIYTGSLELIAINVDEKFKEIASHNNIRVKYFDTFPESCKIMLGVITDNFLSGFKLKVLELITMGCVIVSFADISSEFEDIPYADLFIQKIKSLNEIDTVYSRLNADKNVIEKFLIFYRNVYEKFDWTETARTIRTKLEEL